MDNLTHPGHVIRNRIVEPHLAEERITLKEFCARWDIGYPHFTRVLKGKGSISPNLALQLSEALGFSEMFFANLQTRYNMEEAKRSAGKRLEVGRFPTSSPNANPIEVKAKTTDATEA